MMTNSVAIASAPTVFETDTSLFFDLDGVASMNRELAGLSEATVRKLFDDVNDGLGKALRHGQGKTALRILHPMFLMELTRRDIPRSYSLNRLGVALRLTGNFDKSIDALRWAISTSIYNDPNHWMELARTFKEAGRLTEALEAIDSAMDLKPTHSEYSIEKSAILAQLRRDQKEARRLEFSQGVAEQAYQP